MPKESELKTLKKEIEDAKLFVENAEKAKANFGDTKSLKEMQVSDLKKEMDELKEIQTSTMKELDDAKTSIEDFDHDLRAALRRFSEMEAQRRVMSASGSSLPITTVMNANLEGVHAPLMQLGTVDEEYSLALDVAFGGRLAHIVVDDPHAAYIAMELLNSSKSGRATFIPLNKIKKAPTKLQLPKNRGVIDFAINLVDFEDIYSEGITKITPEDMEYAAKLGRTIKLLGTSRRLADGTCYAMVAPFMLGQNSPLYSVNDVFNAVFVHGNMLGDAMFYGSGAGKLPTASAVVGDIVDAAKHLHVNIVTNWNSTPAVLKPLDEVTGRFFVRIKKEAAEEAKKVFGDVEIISLGQLPQECAFITDEMTQGAFEEKLAQTGDQVLAKIRVKD